MLRSVAYVSEIPALGRWQAGGASFFVRRFVGDTDTYGQVVLNPEDDTVKESAAV